MDVFPFDANRIPEEKKSEEELIAEQRQQAEAQKLNAGKYTNLYTKTQPRTGEIVAN